MSPPLWWRVPTTPPKPFEPSPYADRLTLAEAFHVDDETRARGEDRSTYHTLADSFVETLVALLPKHPR